ncbi:MobF family relaxase [Dactylosporangium sp. NPDC005572]|uniref:MobF family relaxase n=1 Tax=Dactylosporangium sp. NPDC005572 TaxID=3156889 RepID=UPI0033AF2165
MLSITKIHPGAGVNYLLNQVAPGKHDFRPGPNNSAVTYFANAEALGGAPGWWAGQAQELFGIGPIVQAEELQRLIGEGRHPLTGEQLGRLWRRYEALTDSRREERAQQALDALPVDATVEQRWKVWLDVWTAPERRPVSGYDVTVSMRKSESLLWAFGDDTVKAHVMAAHHSAIRATVVHLRTHAAFTRLGTDGVAQVDTDGLAVAVFDHRMSREQDPQVHSHIVISSKVAVTGDNGERRWYALDGRALYQASVSARIVYERAVEVELGRRLGVRYAARPGSTIREIVGISPRAVAVYSKRRAAIEAAVAAEPAAGSAAMSMRRWRRLAQVATLRTRLRKDGAESTAQAVRRWGAEDARHGLDTAGEVRTIVAGHVRHDTAEVAVRALRRARRALAEGAELTELDVDAAVVALGVGDEERRAEVLAEAVRRDPRLAVGRAVRDLSADRAVFNLDHLELAIGRILHISASEGTSRDWSRVHRLAVHAANRGWYGLRVLTPPGLVSWGPTLLRGSDRQPIYTRHRQLLLTTQAVLDVEQQVLGYAAQLRATSAPAGLLQQVAEELQLSAEKREALVHLLGDERSVVGVVGPAGTGKTYLQRAVGVVAARAGIPVLGLTVSQNAAEVLAAESRRDGAAGFRTENIAMWLHAQHTPPANSRPGQWDFQPGQWLIVDEASQASSIDLAALVALLEPVGGKLILVGDQAQIPAIGPGGLLRHLAGIGRTVQLREIRRFREPWEGPASLRLRVGDTTVLRDFDQRGRIVSGTLEQLTEQLLRGWVADTLDGLDSLILVETEAEAADLAAQARAMLIHAGIVARGRRVELANGTRASADDIVVTRHNDRRLTTDPDPAPATTLAAALGLGSGRAAKFVANRDRWRVLRVGRTGTLHVRNLRTDDEIVLPTDYVREHVQLGYAATVDSAQGRTVDTARALIRDSVTRARLYVMTTRGRLANQLYVLTNPEPPEPHPTQPPISGTALLADILRVDDTDRTATETGQTLLADHDALHMWGPVFEDLLGRTYTARYAVIVAQLDPVAGARLAGDPAMAAVAYKLRALADAGYDDVRILTAAVQERELATARSVAEVLAWRLDDVYRDLVHDPRRALAARPSHTYTARLTGLTSAHPDVASALQQVAEIADQRIVGLAELAADQPPRWAAALGPVPSPGDEAGRRAWLEQAEVVIAYRDRYQHTGDDPIGSEPPVRDTTRWTAWHRAQFVLGTATLAGEVHAAGVVGMRAFLAAMREADAREPAYVADELRTAHLDLIEARDAVRELRTELAAAQHQHTTQQPSADARRWWQAGPPASSRQANKPGRPGNPGSTRVDALRQDLDAAVARAGQLAVRVRELEQRHRAWTDWYTETLPARYAGLLANAERARRLHHVLGNTNDVLDRIRTTTAKVHALQATRPTPHARPVPEHLAEAASAATERLTVDRDRDTTTPNREPGLDL